MFKIVILCHGNIMRSQVLGLYLRHYALLLEKDIEVFSAGVADWDAYPGTVILLDEVYRELKSRKIDIKPVRNVWGREVEGKIKDADVVLTADMSVKQEVISKSANSIELHGRLLKDWMTGPFIMRLEKVWPLSADVILLSLISSVCICLQLAVR